MSMTPAEIRTRSFATRWRGYDPDEVRRHLEQLAAELDVLNRAAAGDTDVAPEALPSRSRARIVISEFSNKLNGLDPKEVDDFFGAVADAYQAAANSAPVAEAPGATADSEPKPAVPERETDQAKAKAEEKAEAEEQAEAEEEAEAEQESATPEPAAEEAKSGGVRRGLFGRSDHDEDDTSNDAATDQAPAAQEATANPEDEAPMSEADDDTQADDTTADDTTAAFTLPSDTPSADWHTQFGSEIAAIVKYATDRADEITRRTQTEGDALRRAVEAEAAAERKALEDEIAGLRRQAFADNEEQRANANVDAEGIRKAAEEEAQATLQAANSIREEAEALKQRASDEAASIVQSAKSTRAESERRSAEQLSRARSEADDIVRAAVAEHERLQNLDQELRRRLERAESVFRTLQGDGSED